MGSVGDHWREAREDRRYFNDHGHWPGQKLCKRCGEVFSSGDKKYDKCRHCTQAWGQGYVLVKRDRHD